MVLYFYFNNDMCLTLANLRVHKAGKGRSCQPNKRYLLPVYGLNQLADYSLVCKPNEA